MKTINLDGKWELKNLSNNKTFNATVPGLNYLDLMDCGEIADPYMSDSDKDYAFFADTEWLYKRIFKVTQSQLKAEKIELYFERLDTLAEIYLNGKLIAQTKNIHQTYAFDIKSYIQLGENEIEVKFRSLKKYIDERQKLLNLPYNAMGTTGHPHIRKCACHFGWDFAAELAMQGISGHCEIKFIDSCRITDLSVKQKLLNSNATITVNLRAENIDKNNVTTVILTYPNGETKEISRATAKEDIFEFFVESPELWWSNGLGSQPLYKINVTINKGKTILHSREKKIGIRTITLNRDEDKFGRNFQFYVNGVPIFAKGGNYISPDLLYTRITHEKLYKLLSYCKDANMNMLRVWGGGFYESDDFYDICDELGILVWQDCAFACCAYPFTLNDYLDSVKEEIRQNVKRIMHHPSLALWCGNNEIESISMAWLNRKSIIDSTEDFFYNILPSIIKEYDDVTPYHACSPSSGDYMKLTNSDKAGDTHLWNVWHGFQYKEYFLKRYTRFCSEFGMQSYPCDGVMPHQKCDMGDERLKYYLTKHFTYTENDEDIRYLTQLIQLETMKMPVEHFRRNSNRCHGSLYWQLNDCWDSISWAAVDYKLNKKALFYSSKGFYENIHVSAVKKSGMIDVYISNDTVKDVRGRLVISVAGTDEKEYIIDDYQLIAPATASVKADSLKVLNFAKTEDIIIFRLYSEDNLLISENRIILCENNEMKFIEPNISYKYEIFGNTAEITLSAENYARYVAIRIDGEINNFSDNFFDLSSGESKTISVELSSTKNLESRIHIKSVYDSIKGRNKLQDMKLHNKMTFLPMSLANRISRYFDK